MILSLDEEKEKRSRRRVRRYRLFSVSLIQNERSAVRRFRDLCSEVQQRVPLIQSNSTAWEKNEGQPKREQQSSPAVNPFACLLLALFPSLSLSSLFSPLFFDRHKEFRESASSHLSFLFLSNFFLWVCMVSHSFKEILMFVRHGMEPIQMPG